MTKGISVKFRPGKDDDIQQWWENEPDRAYIIRQLIRNWLLNNQSEEPNVMFKNAPQMVFDAPEPRKVPSKGMTAPPKKQELKGISGKIGSTDLMSQFE